MQQKKDREDKAKPRLSLGRIKASQDAISKIVDAIYRIDITIDEWNEQLKRAQPHRNGRLLVIFSNHVGLVVGNERIYDIEPIVGKMVKMQSGAWRFFQLTAKDKYKTLSDLRVGKGLPSDRLVVRLINGLEDMLKQRAELVEMLVALRRGTPGKIASIFASCERRSIEVVDLSSRVQLDWTVSAAAAELELSAKNRERYLAKKEKKILLNNI